MADTQPRILIVEDEGPLSDVLKERFQNEGFEVFTSKDGADGLLVALDKKPAVILLDIMMPKVSGLDMLKQLRTYDEGKKMKVIVMTNLSDSKEVHEALASGATDFLVKSDWAIADLVDSVRNQLPKN